MNRLVWYVAVLFASDMLFYLMRFVVWGIKQRLQKSPPQK